MRVRAAEVLAALVAVFIVGMILAEIGTTHTEEARMKAGYDECVSSGKVVERHCADLWQQWYR